jgi:hypothetical protein
MIMTERRRKVAEAPTKLGVIPQARSRVLVAPTPLCSISDCFTGELPYVVCSDFLFSEVVVGDIVLLSTGNCSVEGVSDLRFDSSY